MPEPEVKLSEGYSLKKGLVGALKKLGVAAGGIAIALLADPDFAAALMKHAATLGGGGLISLALMVAINYAKNRNK